MNISNIYKNVTITNAEFIQVLTKLHYQKKDVGENYVFANNKYNSIVILPIKPMSEPVQKVHLATYTFRLFLQGVIKQEDDIIKMVEKNRIKQKEKEKQEV